ncbi:MAG: hypothetical protein C4521_11185 [Actinobacteria bacterium]|nr:MAG: hypothetical protein C4521_11185 [Actinomycetota bacterium]
MTKSIAKDVVVVATDHRGKKIHGAVVRFLRGRGKQVISLPHMDENDSYADIARDACTYLERGNADSAVLIDQFGSAVASVANMFFGTVAMTAWSPHAAYEITRKCNPNVLCIPAEDGAGGKISPEQAVAIVEKWVDTEFLEGVPEAEHDKYEGRDDENRRIHLGIIDGLLSGRRRLPSRQIEPGDSTSSAKPTTDMLAHYDEYFEE